MPMVWNAGHQLQNGKYVIGEVLGRGGFGITYKALHVRLQEEVVVKTPDKYLKTDPQYSKFVERFIKEGQMLAKLSRNSHPNIVRVRDLFQEGETHCLVMDFVPGENLFQVVKRRGKLAEVEAISCMRQIAGALATIHKAGLVHRDAHPGNIILRDDGRAILIDFGIAKELIPATIDPDEDITAGNQAFSPYEQLIRGSREPNADVYCLAATLYYAVTGQCPATSLERKLHDVALTPPQQIEPAISTQLNQAIFKGMALEAKDRPQSMQQWLKLFVVYREHKQARLSTNSAIQNGKYIIEKQLGEGGFGITYRALHVPLQEQVVIKTLTQSRQSHPQYNKYLKRFIKEGQILAKLSRNSHPNIVRVRDFVQEGETHCLVMDFVPGENLFEVVKRRGKLPEAEAISCVRQIAGALVMIHEAGLVHRDAHPGNIILRDDGRAILIDFGIAKELAPTTMSTAGKIGQEAFAPYEQLTRGSREPNVDVYCLAATLYYAVTGQYPATSLERKLHDFVLIPPQQIEPTISRQLNEAILKGMALEPEDRPQSIREWLKLLEAPQTIVKPLLVNQNLRREVARPGFGNARMTRSRFLKWMGFGSVGIMVTVIASSLLFRKRLSEQTPSTKLPTESPEPISSQAAPEIIESSAEPKTPDIDFNNLPALPNSAKTFNFEVVTVNAMGQEVNRQKHQAKFFPEDLGNGVMLEMVAIPGGTFTMGSPETEEERSDLESPQHQVSIQPFFIGKYEITQAQWKAVAAFPKVERDLNPDPSNFKGAKRPVERVSWYDAAEFCQRLSKKTGREYRLPSEAEWEYGCRAGTTTPFYFGETITTELVNYNGDTYASGPKGQYRQQTTDVGSFPPNAFGLYDLHGNVWEWCADHWHENYQGAPNNETTWLTSNEDSPRLLRGGSWFVNPMNCRSANRVWDRPVFRGNDFGFRVVVVA